MGLLEADEIVAAVVGASENDAVAGASQLCHGLLEGLGGDGGRVGVDEADGGEAASEDVLGGEEKTLAEAVAALEDEAEGGWEDAFEEGFVAGRGCSRSGLPSC